MPSSTLQQSTNRQTIGPEITRPDSHAVYISYWYVEGAKQGRALLDAAMAAWQSTPWPEGILSVSCYLSTDEDVVLTYAQCTDDSVHRAFAAGLALPEGPASAPPVEYRLHRDVLVDLAGQIPGALVAASFDVDGSERQHSIVDAIVRTVEGASAEEQAGLIAAHFHLSVDGSRVFNFAEWTTDEAHIEFLGGELSRRSLQIANDMPGVRPLGFRRYHLHRSLAA
ncbi:antibiotic biosynthesis monooxygenase [Streptomyces sp. NBC_00237]|uniref:antibiotic biosynthesis monooxygenase n=1 Tax=Streptomyces sp. NBC_00237 TaxID=2975687 RepID=UPI002257ABF5|nr:antibiotic biosynthesis monooxygenase [Streptomyces sp. NBC_00237]MCX5203233.1 antibiotic biosynthesis monooxygenase [Streptomyces sp. NBC_00237]